MRSITRAFRAVIGAAVLIACVSTTSAQTKHTLDKFKVPEKERGEVLGAISSMKNDIVTAPSDMGGK